MNQECPPEKELNIITNKCVKQCPPDKTRYVNVTRKKYRCHKKCTEKQHRNPKTNRCRRSCTEEEYRNLRTNRCVKLKSNRLKKPTSSLRSLSEFPNSGRARSNTALSSPPPPKQQTPRPPTPSLSTSQIDLLLTSKLPTPLSNQQFSPISNSPTPAALVEEPPLAIPKPTSRVSTRESYRTSKTKRSTSPVKPSVIRSKSKLKSLSSPITFNQLIPIEPVVKPQSSRTKKMSSKSRTRMKKPVTILKSQSAHSKPKMSKVLQSPVLPRAPSLGANTQFESHIQVGITEPKSRSSRSPDLSVLPENIPTSQKHRSPPVNTIFNLPLARKRRRLTPIFKPPIPPPLTPRAQRGQRTLLD